MKPDRKFKMRVNLKSSINPSSKAEANIARKSTNAKNEQLANAVEWCRKNNARGHSAIKSGLFPLIKDQETINRRLDGKIVNGNERQYCSILTEDEELSIVTFIKNKNRAMQGLNRAELTKLIMDILRVRSFANKKMKGGRKYVKLSQNAKNALTKNRCFNSFAPVLIHFLLLCLVTNICII